MCWFYLGVRRLAAAFLFQGISSAESGEASLALQQAGASSRTPRPATAAVREEHDLLRYKLIRHHTKIIWNFQPLARKPQYGLSKSRRCLSFKPSRGTPGIVCSPRHHPMTGRVLMNVPEPSEVGLLK